MQTSIHTRQGSTSTVFASFLHFDMCFTLWVLLGSLSIFITKDLGLNNAQQGLLVAILYSEWICDAHRDGSIE